jgi:hypothetical protein
MDDNDNPVFDLNVHKLVQYHTIHDILETTKTVTQLEEQLEEYKSDLIIARLAQDMFAAILHETFIECLEAELVTARAYETNEKEWHADVQHRINELKVAGKLDYYYRRRYDKRKSAGAND